jgi:hypothetical protein
MTVEQDVFLLKMSGQIFMKLIHLINIMLGWDIYGP